MRLHLTTALIALLAVGGTLLSAADGGDRAGAGHENKAVETATSTGAVTAVNAEKKEFSLKADGSDETDSYRPYYRGGEVKKVLEEIAKLKVGDRVTVTYTENEGRRAISIEPAKAEKK